MRDDKMERQAARAHAHVIADKGDRTLATPMLLGIKRVLEDELVSTGNLTADTIGRCFDEMDQMLTMLAYEVVALEAESAQLREYATDLAKLRREILACKTQPTDAQLAQSFTRSQAAIDKLADVGDVLIGGAP